MQRKPLASIGEVVSVTGLTPPTVGTSFERLSEPGLMREVTGQQRNRLYVYRPYVDLVTSD